MSNTSLRDQVMKINEMWPWECGICGDLDFWSYFGVTLLFQ